MLISINKFKNSLFAFLVITMVTGCNYVNYFNAQTNIVNTYNWGLIVVPNRDRIDVLHSQTNRVTESLQTGKNPISIVASPDERLILVSNNGSGNVSVFLRDNKEYEYRVASFKKLGDVGSGSKPVGIAFNPNPSINEAYVAYEGDSKILVLDTKDTTSLPKIIRTIDLKGYYPRKIAVNSDGTKLYVTDNKSGKLIILDRKNSYSKSEITLIAESDLPEVTDSTKETINLEGIYIDQPTTIKNFKNQEIKVGSARIFIANHAQDSIIVIKDDKIEKTISLRDSSIDEKVKVGPKNMAIYRKYEKEIEKLYVTGYIASLVSVVDLKTLTLLKNIPLTKNISTKDGYNPVGIANGIISAKEDVLYVTNTSGLDKSLIEPITDTLKRNIGTSIGSPSDPLGEIITIKK